MSWGRVGAPNVHPMFSCLSCMCGLIEILVELNQFAWKLFFNLFFIISF